MTEFFYTGRLSTTYFSKNSDLTGLYLPTPSDLNPQNASQNIYGKIVEVLTVRRARHFRGLHVFNNDTKHLHVPNKLKW